LVKTISSILKIHKKLCLPLTVSLISLLITIQPAISQSNIGFNWRYTAFDETASGFNPQNALNKNNIGQLKQEWMVTLSQPSARFGNETERTTSSLIMMNGILYLIDRGQVAVAINAENNKIMWTTPLSPPDPTRYGLEEENVHMRQINFLDEKVWIIDLDCTIKGLNRITGEIKVEIPSQVLCGDIPPDAKPHDTVTRGVSAPILYKKEGILIAAPSGFETVGRSVSYVVGISLESGEVVWRTPLVSSEGGDVALGWGQWSIDEDEGVVYIGTGPPISEWNATYRPGPNLYSDSIIALDASTGKILWSYQATPHDINGYGCTYNVVLGEVEGRKVVYSACRNGYLYALDAKTGSLLWYFDPPSVKRLNNGNGDFVKTGSFDPDKPWANYPSRDPFVQCPGAMGAVSSSIALAYNTIYFTTFNSCSRVDVAPVEAAGGAGVSNITLLYEPVGPVNSTLYAVDASTGREKWSRFFDGYAFKGGITVSGGLVYVPSPESKLYAFDASTGDLVWERSFGALGLAIPPIIGATAKGNWTLIQVLAGTPLLERELESRSGFLFAFILPVEAVTTIAEKQAFSVNYYLIAAVVAVAIALLTALSYYRLKRRR